jgi:hypothetical protein
LWLLAPVPAPAKDSAQISELIGVPSDISFRLMGDKSPKDKSKQAVQKQTKADVVSQKKKDATSAKQIPKAKK